MSQVLKFREQLNLTQEQLAEKAKISVRTIQRIEAGVEPKGHTLEAISKALGVDKNELVVSQTKKEDINWTTIKLINISSLFLIFVPFANIVLPLVITYWKKAFNPLTKQIISIQILWTLLFPLVILTGVFVGKIVDLNNHMVPTVILLMLFGNAYIIIRNTIELDKQKKLYISLKFSIL